ncbi:hypothetical protein KBD20_00675 [Candidatus Saccharibacteria bacterium]|nr:hypothetical protein [Candidatus Saccharibacteria bacterium]
MSETTRSDQEPTDRSFLDALLLSAEAGTESDITYEKIGRVRITSARWAAEEGEQVVYVQHEYERIDPWTKIKCRYGENYLIGRTEAFHKGEYPTFRPNTESEVSVFYLSNSYTEMEGWRDITNNIPRLENMASLIPATEL